MDNFINGINDGEIGISCKMLVEINFFPHLHDTKKIKHKIIESYGLKEYRDYIKIKHDYYIHPRILKLLAITTNINYKYKLLLLIIDECVLYYTQYKSTYDCLERLQNSMNDLF